MGRQNKHGKKNQASIESRLDYVVSGLLQIDSPRYKLA